MAECTELERAYLDALHAGHATHDARVQVMAERVRGASPELVADYMLRRSDMRAAQESFRKASEALWNAIGAAGETGAAVIKLLTHEEPPPEERP